MKSAENGKGNKIRGKGKRPGKPAKPLRKMIIGGILLTVLSGLFVCFLVFDNVVVNTARSIGARISQMKAMSEDVERNLTLYSEVAQEEALRNLEKMELSFAAFGDDIRKEADGKPCYYGDGAVVQVSDGEVVYPEGFPEDVVLDPEFASVAGNVAYSVPAINSDGDDFSSYLIFYIPLEEGSDLYYIEWESVEAAAEKQKILFDANKSFAGIEKAFGANLLLFPVKADAEGKHALIYHSDNLPQHICAEDYGITEEMMQKAVGSFRNLTAEQLSKAYYLLEVDGALYEVFLQKFNSATDIEDSILAYMIPYEDTWFMMLEQSVLTVGVFVIIGVFLLVWASSTLVLVRDHDLNEKQKAELAPKKIRRRGLDILLIGGIIVLIAAALFLALVRLYSTCHQVTTSLETLQERLDDNESRNQLAQNLGRETYEGFAVQIGRILEEHPEYATRKILQGMCDIVEADYIMLFDKNGDEILTNAPFVNVSLGKEPGSASYDFRRLLQGVSLITGESAVNDLTGEETVMIGVRVETPREDPDADPEYEALLLAVPASKIHRESIETTGEIMYSLVSEKQLAFSVDPETHLILDASDSTLVGENAHELGLPERALVDGFRDFFNLDGLPYYGECAERSGIFYYYAAVQSHIYQNVWFYSLVAVAGYFILMGLYLIYVLFGYRRFFETWSEIGEVLEEESKDQIELSRGKWKRSVDPSLRWKPSVIRYGTRAPIHLAFRVAEGLLTAVIIILGARLITSRSSSRTSLMSFVLQGKWAKGFNLFSIISIMILLGEVIVISMTAKLILRLLSDAMGTKGETICRLLINLVSYAGAIIFVYFALYDVGFDSGALLTSLGLMSFAVSLGAKDLITDIIAGLSIVFEGEYQVGDIIDVGGYRGEVLEIGVRTMKLEGRGGNIKIFSNRDVKNVVNMTRLNSWVALEVTVSGSRPLPEIEKELELILPAIGKSIKDIISGPYYKGVAAIGKGGANTLSITAECNEEDYYSVQRAMNRAIQEAFEEHDIQIV